MLFKKIIHYLNPATLFSKGKSDNVNLKMMHGINRISIFVFLICIIVLIIRWLT